MVALAVMLAIVAIAISLPLAVSSDLVRDRLERDIGAWAGHPVSLGNAPSMSFWPLPTIKLDNVEISPSSFADGDPIMRADSIIANFNLFSAILGAPSFSEFKLVRPTFSLEVYPDGTSNWESLNGELANGIKAAVALDVAAQAGQPVPKGASIPDSATLGTVEIEDGTVQWIRDPGAPPEKLTAVNGTVAWTSPTAAARVSLSAIIRGEQVTIVTSIGSPLLLLGRRATTVDATLTSPPLNLSFNGTLSLATEAYFNGSLKLKSPSVRRALEWSGTEIKPGEALGALEMAADISIGGRAAKLDNLTIMIDQNKGVGVLDVELPADTPPTVGGTLAFNTLDITSFLQAFTPLPKAGDDIASTIDTRFLREIGLDLRLSAQTARFGPVSMTNLAAAARVEEGRAMFDIGDASAYGGSLTGRIAISEKGVDGGAKLRISARNTDFGKLFDAMEMTGPLPRGIGTLDLEVASPHPTWATSMTDLTGKIKLTLGKGTTPGFDLDHFKELAKTDRFFGIKDTMTGNPFAFKAAQFEATIADGQAELTIGELIGASETISLSGVVPYSRGSLAIAGVIGKTKPGEGEAALATKPSEPPLRFFVGGSWPQPVFSPVAN